MKISGHRIAVPAALFILSNGVNAFQPSKLDLNLRTIASSEFLPPQTQKAQDPTTFINRRQTTTLFLSTKIESGDRQPELDVDAITKYALAGAVQMGSFYVVLNAMNFGVANLGLDHVPLWVNGLFFYACSLKSRALNPLNNQRPNVENATGAELVRPSWTPPGVVFPIMWLLIIGPIRAYSSALVIDAAGGDYANLATLSFLLHLSVGDIWNTINNVEKRLGAAASGVILVVLSAANAAYQYYQFDELAGELLGLTLLWLVTAGTLVNSIWQLNPIDSVSGERDALYPVKREDVTTDFAWFGNNSN